MNIYGKIISYHEKILEENRKMIMLLEQEQKEIGGYGKRYEELKPFRAALGMLADGNLESDDLSPKITVMDNGHVLDHHVLGYLAPMEFKRVGFGNIYRNPLEQMMLLNEQLVGRGIRFIYVPLPCKLALYPEIAKAASLIPNDGLVIPQWRNLLYQLSLSGLEIVDCYNALQKAKGERCVFSRNHHISPYGAEIIAYEISKYLKQTIMFDESASGAVFTKGQQTVEDYVLQVSGDYSSPKLDRETFEINCISMEANNNKCIYIGNEIETEICIIGDCNLQSYQHKGCDITAKLSYDLKYPIYYGGRYLPFARVDSIEKMPKSLLEKKKVLIYVGFVSASFVRAYRNGDVWSRELIPEEVFDGERNIYTAGGSG